MDNKPSEISILPSEERARAEERIAQPQPRKASPRGKHSEPWNCGACGKELPESTVNCPDCTQPQRSKPYLGDDRSFVHPLGHLEGNQWCPHKQQPPATEQELTRYEFIRDNDPSHGASYDMRATPDGRFVTYEQANAAIAAEQQKRAGWNVVIEDLETALKSKEDELQAFLTDADSARDSWIKANNDLEQQLAAERGNRDGFRRALEQRIGEVDELRQQLLAAQAAIADAIACRTYHNLKSVDLSALKAHDKEVRKPLVDALKGWRTYYPNMREAIDMLLAKVKEAPPRHVLD